LDSRKIAITGNVMIEIESFGDFPQENYFSRMARIVAVSYPWTPPPPHVSSARASMTLVYRTVGAVARDVSLRMIPSTERQAWSCRHPLEELAANFAVVVR